jgi:Tfp pilus assembly protein PilN
MTGQSLPRVNLLHGRSEQLHKEHLAFAKVQFIVIIVLVFYIGFLAVVFGINTYINNQLKTVSTTIKSEELALAKLKPTEEKYTILANKLKLLTDYFRSKGKAREFVLKIYQTLPDGVALASVILGGNEDSITIKAQAQDMKSIIDYINMLNQDVKSGVYRQVLLTGLSRSLDGKYAINSEYLLAE